MLTEILEDYGCHKGVVLHPCFRTSYNITRDDERGLSQFDCTTASGTGDDTPVRVLLSFRHLPISQRPHWHLLGPSHFCGRMCAKGSLRRGTCCIEAALLCLLLAGGSVLAGLR
jgi:hypothetical protein